LAGPACQVLDSAEFRITMMGESVPEEKAATTDV
jgi:hypothetical protein